MSTAENQERRFSNESAQLQPWHSYPGPGGQGRAQSEACAQGWMGGLHTALRSFARAHKTAGGAEERDLVAMSRMGDPTGELWVTRKPK